MKTYSGLELLVIRWAEARKIIPNSTTVSQLNELFSEVGKLANAENKKDTPAIKDAVGDVLICLINYCALHDIAVVDCLSGSYEQIKNRRWTLMPDGTFVEE